MLRVIKKLEYTMSFPIFLAFCKITLQAFSIVLLWKKGSNDNFTYLYTSISAMEMISLFVIIAFLADLFQRRFLMNINSLLCDESRFKLLEVDNVSYKRMLQDKLTAWDMCAINRKLVLTFMASLATYSVLIMDQINAL
ncbi:hypothetical protein TNIN_292871 [Trichonephila inaurata madagascariensis]|uniref:Uncharacterized protein n=1 Tax=Trichonephila inaurata madagascariensis TaxID=2747483 RepID=A0A8X6WSW8_9ARAC|nr:hypothetical protein TNIN_292871 [Trichonephila inaurata madagascariensis]